MVAVENLDVHAGLGHPARELPELAGEVLPESLQKHLALSDDADVGGLERRPRSGTVLEQEVADGSALGDPCSATLGAHPGAAQRVSHVGQRARAVVKGDLEIVHADPPHRWWPVVLSRRAR